ncbi:SOF1 protein [Spironucleus salmonicida]|uniref:SOF1 protein n=1 Tax=Spironucleus salmonicida TaxID=348837 RepID=V6LPT9_9EUKA|nr:SOF1 protein [Spironucleus salmonicida]|eukprot:EST45726.1 SOF1 protein [Spironucleus salmonicida]
MPPIIKALLRSEEKFVRTDYSQKPRVFKEEKHFFQQETELQRAVQASKMERLFSKPLIKQLDGHPDSIVSISQYRGNLLSSGMDGSVKLWDAQGGLINSIQAHNMCVGSVNLGQVMLSVGRDGKLFWLDQSLNLTQQVQVNVDPKWICASSGGQFAISSYKSQLYDITRGEPISSFQQSNFSIFSQQDPNLLLLLDGISVIIKDVRMNADAFSFKTAGRSNQACFNPMFPGMIVLAQDDGCGYSFDLKNPKQALDKYGGQTFPMVSVDISPSGRDIVLGNNQGQMMLYKTRTVQRNQVATDTILKAVNQEMETARSQPFNQYLKYRDLYHARRMHQVNVVKFSEDGRYIFSGSSEGAIRQWKTFAEQNERTKTYSQDQNISVNKQLSQKFQNVGIIRDVRNSHKVPRKIHAAQVAASAHHQAEMRKLHKGKNSALDVVRKEQ